MNVHDYVSEMPVGTWLEFLLGGERVNARLSWASPLRTKYIFTSRSRSRALAYSPERINPGQSTHRLENTPQISVRRMSRSSVPCSNSTRAGALEFIL
jgi:hypothetical protein